MFFWNLLKRWWGVRHILLALTQGGFKLRQVYNFLLAAVDVIVDDFSEVKDYLVRRMFWGRGSLYKNAFHVVVFVLSAIFLVTGILQQLGSVEAREEAIEVSYGAIGNNDLLTQGSSISTVLAVDESAPNYEIILHQVEQGETVEEIAAEYGLNKDTIIWANTDEINPFNPQLQEGQELKVPEVDGVLYEVEAGETVEDVAQKAGSNVFDIVEINELVPPDYEIEPGDMLFIPEGELAPQPIPGLYREYFQDPLSHPACENYSYIRGFTSYHKGVDLAIAGGCPIQAVAAGTVTYAGWRNDGSGYMVAIDHGGGVVTHYYHGNGQIWVKTGDYVDQGDNLMYMGCTGNCTGTHLHLGLRKDNVLINPSPYIPYYNGRYR